MIDYLFDGLADDFQTFNWIQLFLTCFVTYLITKFTSKAQTRAQKRASQTKLVE